MALINSAISTDQITIKAGNYQSFEKKIKTNLLKLTLANGCIKKFIKGKWFPYIVVAFDRQKPIGWCAFFPKNRLFGCTLDTLHPYQRKNSNSLPMKPIAGQLHFYVSGEYREKGIAKLLAKRMLQYFKQYRPKELKRVMPWHNISEKFFNWLVIEAEQNYQLKIQVGWEEDIWTSFAVGNSKHLKALKTSR